MLNNTKSDYSYNNVDIELEPELFLREYGYEDFNMRSSDRFYHKKLYHIFQFVMHGKGYYYLNGHKYTVKKGDMFYIPPDIPIMHYESTAEPYLYYWFSLFGEKAKNLLSGMPLSILSPVASLKENEKILNELQCLIEEEQNVFSIKAHIYKILSYIVKPRSLVVINQAKHQSLMLQEIINFIEINYSQQELQIQKLLELFHLSQTQLYRLFINNLGVSPKQFLLNFRMNKAAEALTKKCSITKTSEYVGYQNIYHFSKQFKIHFGVSPSDYIHNIDSKT